MNRNGKLDPYEDWRLDPQERACDLASQLSLEEIAGLMLYSSHEPVKRATIPLSQRVFITKNHGRAILITTVKDAATAARWNNNIQALTEGLDHGIPCNTSSDPRHGCRSDMEFNAGAGGAISLWPNSLGMAATFDPDLVAEFGHIASEEYRALGIATALSPQIDIATEPRWWRYSGTFGESTALSTDMARAYCDGFQTSSPEDALYGSWGWKSVNAMVKHWYGYGAQEGGRDSHFTHGKYAVYPGHNLSEHKISFTEGAFKLKEGTGSASAVMPIYSILWNQDPEGNNVGGSYSPFLIQQELRDRAGFEGVVCTDWHITFDNNRMDNKGLGKPWGVENLSVAERHYRVLLSGVDQFGGNNDIAPILEAYRMWVGAFGEKAAREHFELSARRLLLNSFRLGLFENPYLDPEVSAATVGKTEFMNKGYEAQRKSVVLLKNHGYVLPVRERKKVYLPQRHFPATPGIWTGMSEDYYGWLITPESAGAFYEVVERPEEADFALVAIREPSISLGYDQADAESGGSGYLPISLQYEDYTAGSAREQSLAQDPKEAFPNRSYKGKTARTLNRDDMLLVQKARKEMGDKPVIVVVELGRPLVLSEIEPYADALLLSFEVQGHAVLDIVSGKASPSALLPMQLPQDMETVEGQAEDIPGDMRCYRDADGNVYDFGYGRSFTGVISDKRTALYAPKRD